MAAAARGAAGGLGRTNSDLAIEALYVKRLEDAKVGLSQIQTQMAARAARHSGPWQGFARHCVACVQVSNPGPTGAGGGDRQGCAGPARANGGRARVGDAWSAII